MLCYASQFSILVKRCCKIYPVSLGVPYSSALALTLSLGRVDAFKP